MNQTIDGDIIARFGRQGWLVQKIKESFWALRPQGAFNYKVFLLTYNPFTSKFQIVKPPNPVDPHYNIAVQILEASDRPSGGAGNRKRSTSSLSIIRVPSMFPVKIGNLWINLAQIRALKVVPPVDGEQLTLLVRWDDGEEDDFTGDNAEQLLAEYEKAAELIRERFASQTA